MLDFADKHLPNGMKLMIWSPSGLLEWVIALIGYDNLCYLLYDGEALVSDMFERVGSDLLKFLMAVSRIKTLWR